MPESCDWHVHSMFHPCPNGLYRRDYLFEPLPRTVQDVLVNHEIGGLNGR